jgi:hypothetical protein
MNITIKNMSYEHLMWMQMRAEQYQRAISTTYFSEPQFDHEGMAGYIMVAEVIFTVKSLEDFTKLHSDWYKVSLEVRSNWTALMRKELNIK